jgi:hypothetical protein
VRIFFVALLSVLVAVSSCFANDELANRVKNLESYFAGKTQSHPLDPFELLKQETFKHKKNLYITAHNLELRFTNSYGTVESNQYARDFAKTKSLNSHAAKASGKERNVLELYYRDEIIHRFNHYIESATFYDNFLVFVEKDSYDPKTKTKYISFIDLGYVNEQMGKGVELPIFKIPIQVSSADNALSIVKGNIVNSGTAIEKDVFQLFSQSLQLVYNLQSNIVDPVVYEEIVASGQFDDLLVHYKRAMDYQVNHAQEHVENFPGLVKSIKTLRDESLSNIENAKDFNKEFYSAAQDENRKSLQYSDEYFLKNLEKKQEKLLKSQGALAADMASKRKLMARIKLFIARLSFPRPDGAKSIKKALAFVATSLNMNQKSRFFRYLKDGYQGELGKKEMLRQFSLYARRGVAVGGAALVGIMAPEVYGKFMMEGLEIGQHFMTKAKDLGGIVGTGVEQTVISLGKDVGTTFTDGFKKTMVYNTYISSGRLSKTLIGLSTLFSVAAVPFGLSHSLINSVSLFKDMEKDKVILQYKTLTEMDKIKMKHRYGSFVGSALYRFQNSIDNTAAFVTGFPKWFPQRQTRLRLEYLANISDGDKEVNTSKYTPEQDKIIKEVIQEIKDDKKRNSWSSKLSRLGQSISRKNLEKITEQIVGNGYYALGSSDEVFKDFNISILNHFSNTVDKEMDLDHKKIVKLYYSLSLKEFYKERAKLGAGDWVQGNQEDVVKLREVKGSLEKLQKVLIANDVIKKDNWISSFTRFRKKITSTLFAKKNTSLEVKSFGGALKHFLFSYSTFTKSIKEYLKVWNAWFGFRSFVFKPKTLLTLIYYPNYFSRVTSPNMKLPVKDIVDKTRNVVAHYPTELNGAKRTVFEQMKNWLLDPGKNSALRAWEDKIIAVEHEVYKVAFQEALNDISLFTQDIGAINNFVNHGGPQRIDDKVIVKLHWKYKTFFRKHFKTTFDAAMEMYMAELVGKDIADDYVFSASNMAEYKELAMRNVSDLKLDKRKIKNLVKKAKAQSNSFEEAKNMVARLSDMKVKFSEKGLAIENYPKINFENFKYYMEAVKMNVDFDAFSVLNARTNNQVKRMLISARQSHDPQALVRSVRYTVTHFVNDKPMQALLLFLLSAGIPQGELLQPIQNEMFGPNSIGYLSKFVGGMFAYDIVMSLLNTSWMKLQVDASHSESFGYVPPVEIAKKGALHWFMDRTFKYKENSTWNNQKIMNQIITDNLQAAFVNISASNLTVLNRFDLDSYITGYMLAYFPGYYGFATQLDQGIDMSMGQILSEIPEGLRKHPEVMNYYNSVSSRRRLIFNFLYHNFYENPLGMVLSNITNGQDRALARWSFGGYTPTELLAMGFDQALEAVGEDTVAGKVIKSCDRFFTNNYTNFTKYKR